VSAAVACAELVIMMVSVILRAVLMILSYVHNPVPKYVAPAF